MTDKEIEEELKNTIKKMADLSVELLKNRKTMAALISVEIVNVMGVCQVVSEMRTTAPDLQEKLGPILDSLADQMGIPPEGAAPSQAEKDAKSKANQELVDELLKDLRKGNSNPNNN